MLKRVFNKTLLQIFLALLIVICLMFASNYAVFRSSIKAMNHKAEENNNLVVKGIIQSFENEFKEINDTIYTVSNLPYQIYDTQEHENINMHNAFLFINNAADMISQDYVEDYVIFFKGSDLAITSKGTESFNRVFTTRFKNDRFSSNYWRNLAVSRHSQQIVPSIEYTEETFNGDLYKRTLLGVVGSNKVSNSGLNIVIFVNMSKLYNKVNKKSMMEGSSLIILDQDKNTIISTDDNYDINSLGGLYFSSEDETVFKKGKYEYHCVLSAYNGFAYINKVPLNYEDIGSVTRLFKLIILLTSITSIIISLFLSIYLYSPVGKILKLVGIKEDENHQNHYKHIYNSIKKMQYDYGLIKSRMDLMEDEVRRSVFFKMIDDITYYKNLKEQIETYFKVVLRSEKFLMISFLLDNSIIEDMKSKNVVSDDIAEAIQKVIESNIQSSVVFYAEHMQYIALVGLNFPDKRELVIRNINNVVENLKNTVLKDHFSVAVSKEYTEVHNCKEAFKDIKTCFAYRNIRSPKIIIDIEKIEYNYDLYMPLDFDEKLFNYFLCGNAQDCYELVNEVINKNIEKNINYIKFENIVYAIFNSITKAMSYLGYDRNEIIIIEKEFSSKAYDFDDFDDIKKFLNKIVQRAITQIQSENQSKLNKDFILQYIHLHYSENLYLDKISVVAGTTPKYFSNFFKKTFGVNYVEYLNKVRMSHAKEMLKNTYIPISEICEKVGFSNSNTFTITFKKYCGISPTEYRKEYKV